MSLFGRRKGSERFCPQEKKKLKRTGTDKVITTTATDDVDGVTRFSDIPSCIVMDILLRLPIETLLTSRFVCKDWIRLCSDPSFIKLHLASSPLHMLDPHLLKEYGVLRFGRVMKDECTGELEWKIVSFRTKPILPPRSLDFGNSCNGLLCFTEAGSSPKRVYVCNPVLGEWVSTSIPVRNCPSDRSTATALVFSAKSNHYKVLQCFKTVTGECRFEIYTLDGTRQWRSIDESLGCGMWYNRNVCRPNLHFTSLHGSLHWVDRVFSSFIGEEEPFLCCFDADSEKFRRFLMPRPDTEASGVQLVAINGCLSAFYFSYSESCDAEIWTMKDYGVEKSWTKIHVIWKLVNPVILFSLNEEEILIHANCQGLLRYSLKKYRRTGCEGHAEWYTKFASMIAYKPSFVSLQEIAKGEEVMLSKYQLSRFTPYTT